ncbi:MAG: hypothetical protein M0Z28_17930 [Rhodospirillales bacterium]|jgi:hypothetical protein|nr:hypothetical protein [Rhodospirillales bacterium]
MKTNLELIGNFFAQLNTEKLPMHITEVELQQQLGDTVSSYLFSHFDEVLPYLREALGLWIEEVLCPKSPTHPNTGYLTVYRTGQTTLANDARNPGLGPYSVPDELRS